MLFKLNNSGMPYTFTATQKIIYYPQNYQTEKYFLKYVLFHVIGQTYFFSNNKVIYDKIFSNRCNYQDNSK